MITAGVDVGNKYTKVVIMKDGRIASRAMVFSGFNQKQAAGEAFDKALGEAGLKRESVQRVLATGAGRMEVDFADGIITEVGSGAKGALYLFPEGRTVVDVGAEESRVFKINDRGKVIDFTVNEKCAAGTGSFIEAMARALELPVEEMAEISLKSTQSVHITAQCVVFAESEVVSLIHARTPVEDIARAVHDAIAGRIISMIRRIGLEKELILIGGVARNAGYVASLERGLEVKALVPEEPEYVSAIGAAVAATEGK